MLNEKEIRALRFYIGDVSGSDPFFSDPKAYVVLNSLFFPDISSERARAAEGKLLNPAIIADTERLSGFSEARFFRSQGKNRRIFCLYFAEFKYKQKHIGGRSWTLQVTI